MARARSFDEAEVLCAAMHAFRAGGYAGVSIKTLERATGLRSGSLYHTYGDKDGLYRAALAYYVDSFVAERMATHAGPSATLDNLEELFRSLLRAPLADGHGCLVVNAAVEFGPARSIASEGVGRGMDSLHAGLRSVLSREIGAQGADLAAAHLVLLYQGILVLARAGRTEPIVGDVLRAEFDRLRAARREHAAGAVVAKSITERET